MSLSTAPRIAYFQAAPELSPYVSGYHLFCVRAQAGEPYRDVFWPGWMHLRINLFSDRKWRLKARSDDDFKEMGDATLFGPTSGLVHSRSDSGIVVGAGLTPHGWLHVTRAPASQWADRVGDAREAGFSNIDELVARARSISDESQIAPMFDEYFSGMIGSIARPAPMVTNLVDRLAASDPVSVQQLASELGINVRQLQRLSLKAFGFPPKLLMRRARFLRSLAAVRAAPQREWAGVIDASYTDYAHFVRDSHFFLGNAPSAFLNSPNEMAVRSLKLRREVLGQSTQALTRRKD